LAETFRIGLTHDFLAADGQLAMGDIGLGLLRDARGVSVEYLDEYLPEATAKQIRGFDAMISTLPQFTERTLKDHNLRLSILARFGVGYDMVDTRALTNHDVVLTITPDGVRRPVASGIVALILSLAHQLPRKDRLLREGRWKEKLDIKSFGLTGRTLGSVGLGNIALELFRLIKPFEMVHLASDPIVKGEAVRDLGIELVDLETLFRKSDFVCVNCPLAPETRHLIGNRELSWMKPTAFFINTSRGPIVDQAALYGILRDRRIRGAALDVFEQEPIPPNDPLLECEDLILTPHSLCWTDECFRLMGESAIRSVLQVLQGEVPKYAVNREVFERPGMLAKLHENRKRWEALNAEGLA
jgi:phosphoglycerate dehydrogenase-like enzyme